MPGPPVILIQCTGEFASGFDFVLKEIEHLTQTCKCTPAEIAVLYRNNETGAAFKDYLKKHKKHFSTSTKFQTTEKTESKWHSLRVCRLLSTLKLAVDQHDDTACEGALPRVNKATSAVMRSALADAKSRAVAERQRRLEPSHQGSSELSSSSSSLFEQIRGGSCRALKTWVEKILALSSRIEAGDVNLKRIIETAAEVSNTKRCFESFHAGHIKRKSEKESSEELDDDDSDDSAGAEEGDIIMDIINESSTAGQGKALFSQ